MSFKLLDGRANPVLGEEDAPAEGVLSPFEGTDEGNDPLRLLGLPNAGSLLGGRDVRADDAAGPVVYDFLYRIRQALRVACETSQAWRRRIDGLADHDQRMLIDALGAGEVSAVINGGEDEGEVQIAESVLPGVWIGKAQTSDGRTGAQWIEVGDAPRTLRELALRRPRVTIPIDALTPPRGAMNVMSVLAEVRERALNWRPGERNHVFNFTLLPMTPADSAYLAQVLGEAGARISSGGYGAARVIMTGVRHVWAVQYLNGLGTVILDTLEVGDIPDAVMASPEDFEDSASRLTDILEAYAQ